MPQYSNDKGNLKKAQSQLIVLLKAQNKSREAATRKAAQFSKKEKSWEARYGFPFTEEEKPAPGKEKATKNKSLK